MPPPPDHVDSLKAHLELVHETHKSDLEKGLGETYLPDALDRKYPNAAKEWGWQYVFPSGRLSVDPRSGKTRRHHIHENGLQKAIKKAASQANMTKRVNCHALRAIALPRICWKEVMISAPFRSYSAMQMSPQP